MIKNGIKVDKIYKEIASGMNENRKEFNNLISDVQDNKIDKIHHFSMKMYSNRRKKLKEIEEQLKNENNKDSN